jgi:predicted permease
MISEVLTVIAPVFIIAGLGYFWVKRELPFDNATISSLVMYVGSPCLIYSALTSNAAETAALGMMGISAFIVILMSLIFSWVFLKIVGWKLTTYLPALIHPNCGNMGLPLVLLAFGQEGLALGMAYFFVNSISQYTLGMAISSGQFDIRQLMKQPIIWAVIFVLTVILGEFQMPKWFNSTTSILAGLTIPAMLIMLGTSLANLNIASLKETLTISFLRILLGLGLGLLVIEMLSLSGIMAGIVLLQSAMPSAVFNYIFADRFNRESDKVAAVILQSTLISALSLPLLVAWVISF